MENIKKDFQIDSFEYHLENQISFVVDGAKLMTGKVTLYAPSLRAHIAGFTLAQMVNAATLKAVAIFRHLKPSEAEQKLLEEKIIKVKQ